MIFAFALLVSVALHEFGHVFVAQSQGVQVRGVTLMMLGGMSEMEEMPDKPYAELKLSIIGPVVSAAIAGCLFLIRSLTNVPEITLFTTWLGTVNLVLAIFNMLPAFPLDGGRALRSVLAARQGKLRGTQTAVSISKALAWIFGIVGLLGLNFLLMFIAFFVYTAANSELFMLTTRNLLQGLRAGDVGIRTRVVHPAELINDVADQMIESRSVVLPVQTIGDSGALVRLGTFRRIPKQFWSSTRVQEVMERAPKVIQTDELIAEHLPALAASPSGALPLRETDGRLIGLVRSADVFELMQLRSVRGDEFPRHDHRKAA